LKTMLITVWFGSGLLSMLAHNWVLAEYCYRLKSHFPKSWDDIGSPLPFNFAFKHLQFRIFEGRFADIGDRTQIWLLWWARLLLGLCMSILIFGSFLLYCLQHTR
jgi:hypothetical protein